MSDIAYYNDDYSRHLDVLENFVKTFETAVDKISAGAACDSEVSRIKDIKKSFGLELCLIKDKAVRAQYDIKAKEYEKRFNDCLKDIQTIKSKSDRSDLMKGTTKMTISTAGKTNDELLQGASKYQDQTVESIDRTRGLIEQSKEVGTATLEVLKQQREQIKEIDIEVSNIDDNLKKAEKLLTGFARRMATDRLLQCLFGLNLCVLIAVIVYVIYTKKGFTTTTTSSAFNPGTVLSPTFAPVKAPTVSI